MRDALQIRLEAIHFRAKVRVHKNKERVRSSSSLLAPASSSFSFVSFLFFRLRRGSFPVNGEQKRDKSYLCWPGLRTGLLRGPLERHSLLFCPLLLFTLSLTSFIHCIFLSVCFFLVSKSHCVPCCYRIFPCSRGSLLNQF